MDNTSIRYRVLVASICAIFIIGLSFTLVTPREVKIGFSQPADGAIDSENLSTNISHAIEEWIPFVVVMTLIGIALSGLGISLYRRR